jgi:alpha-1,3-rhamnosyltransferase
MSSKFSSSNYIDTRGYPCNTEMLCLVSASGEAIQQTPLVTVVMPCYNHCHYVERAIKSVIDQTYSRVELVVIDDGSRDLSVEMLKVMRDRFGFTLICQENRGVCRTLNRGILEAAHGDYIALLASDDFWHPDKLSHQISKLQRHPGSEFCFSQAIEFTDERNPDAGTVFPGKCLSGNVVDQVFVRQHVPAGTMLFSRKLYDRLGGFDESLKEEDWDFVIRSAAVTPFVSVNTPLLYYRSHQGNTMKTRNRAAIFHQKAKILAKNFDLVNPWRWLFAVCLHFAHDIVLSRLRRG